MVLYNLIFILPMLVITLLVGTGQSSVEKIAKMKNKNTKLMHLIMGGNDASFVNICDWKYVF